MLIRGASPLGLPYTLTRGDPRPRSVRVAHSLRSFASVATRNGRARPVSRLRAGPVHLLRRRHDSQLYGGLSLRQSSHLAAQRQDASDDAGNPLPVVGFTCQLFEAAPRDRRDRIELGFPVVLRRAPLPRDPACPAELPRSLFLFLWTFHRNLAERFAHVADGSCSVPESADDSQTRRRCRRAASGRGPYVGRGWPSS